MPKRARSKKERNAVERSIPYAEENESVYGIVVQPLGGGRFEVSCADSVIRIAKVAGRLHKRVWIQKDDYVLVSLREEDQRKGDIIAKYMPPEVKILKESKVLPEVFGNDAQGDTNIEFEDI